MKRKKKNVTAVAASLRLNLTMGKKIHAFFSPELEWVRLFGAKGL